MTTTTHNNETLLAQQPRDRELLVRLNLGLVHAVVNRMFRTANEHRRDDAVQEGLIGLLRAVDTFDGSKQVRFSTYATACIINALREMLRFEITRKKHHRANRDLMPNTNGYEDEIVEPPNVARLMQQARLNDRQRQVLEWRFGIGTDRVNLKTVGERLGLSTEQARQIEKQALAQMRQHLEP